MEVKKSDIAEKVANLINSKSITEFNEFLRLLDLCDSYGFKKSTYVYLYKLIDFRCVVNIIDRKKLKQQLIDIVDFDNRILKYMIRYLLESINEFNELTVLKEVVLKYHEYVYDESIMELYTKFCKQTFDYQELTSYLNEIEENNLPCAVMLLDKLINALTDYDSKKMMIEKKVSCGYFVTSQNCKELISAITSKAQLLDVHNKISKSSIRMDNRYYYSVLKTSTVYGGTELIYDDIPKEFLEESTFNMLLSRLREDSLLREKIKSDFAAYKKKIYYLSFLDKCYNMHKKRQFSFFYEMELNNIEKKITYDMIDAISDAKFYKRPIFERALYDRKVELYNKKKSASEIEEVYYLNGYLQPFEMPKTLDYVHIKECSDLVEDYQDELIEKYMQGIKVGMKEYNALKDESILKNSECFICMYFSDNITKKIFEYYLKLSGFKKAENFSEESLNRYFITTDLSEYVEYSSNLKGKDNAYFGLVCDVEDKVTFADFIEKKTNYKTELTELKNTETINCCKVEFFNQRDICSLSMILDSINNHLKINF